MIGENGSIVRTIVPYHNVCYISSVKLVNPVLLATLADFCINISAGWFGAAFIVPILSKRKKTRFVSLTINLLLSMMFLIVAFGLRVFEL